jgi:hypothetical protein
MSARCSECGRGLPPSKARLVVNELWVCPWCLSVEEHGESPAPKLPPPVRRGEPQEERLFRSSRTHGRRTPRAQGRSRGTLVRVYSFASCRSPSPAARATRPASARSATWSFAKMAET